MKKTLLISLIIFTASLFSPKMTEATQSIPLQLEPSTYATTAGMTFKVDLKFLTIDVRNGAPEVLPIGAIDAYLTYNQDLFETVSIQKKDVSYGGETFRIYAARAQGGLIDIHGGNTLRGDRYTNLSLWSDISVGQTIATITFKVKATLTAPTITTISFDETTIDKTIVSNSGKNILFDINGAMAVNLNTVVYQDSTYAGVYSIGLCQTGQKGDICTTGDNFQGHYYCKDSQWDKTSCVKDDPPVCVSGFKLCPDGKCYLSALSCPANAASLNLSIIYERVVDNPIASKRTKPAKIVILGKDGTNAGKRWAFTDVPTTYDATVGSGTYNASIDMTNVTTSAAGDKFDIITIGPQHLKKRTNDVTLITGANPATGKTSFGTQRAGDINNPAHDNQVNTLDWEITRTHFQNIGDEVGIDAADLNFDGQVNTLDWDIMRTNFQANGDGE